MHRNYTKLISYKRREKKHLLRTPQSKWIDRAVDFP